MKIALIGSAGAGKTQFARKLARAMARDEILTKPTIIDGYMEDLQNKTGRAFDFTANYSENLQIIFHRRTLEQAAANKGNHTITCGTIYEGIVYCGIHYLIQSDLKGNNAEENIKATAAFKMLGQIETEIYDYEAMFYLPYDEATIISKGRSYDMVVNQKVGETLEGYHKECVILDQTERENVRYAHQIIKAIRQREIEASQDDQLSVRGSGEDDSPISQEVGGMPDMRESQAGDRTGDQGVASE